MATCELHKKVEKDIDEIKNKLSKHDDDLVDIKSSISRLTAEQRLVEKHELAIETLQKNQHELDKRVTKLFSHADILVERMDQISKRLDNVNNLTIQTASKVATISGIITALAFLIDKLL